MRRILIAFLALFLFIPSVCVTALSEGEKVLRVAGFVNPGLATNAYDEYMTDLLERFTEETGIQIELLAVAWDRLDETLAISGMSGLSSADLTWCSSQRLAALMNAQALYPLDDLIERDLNPDDYNPLMWEAVTYPMDGQKYMIMTTIHSRGIWYNTDLMPLAPANWDELVEFGTAATDPYENQWGFGFYCPDRYDAMELTVAPFIWAAGGAICTEDGAGAWNSREAREGIRFLSDLVHEYKIAPTACFGSNFQIIEDGFKNGSIACILNGAYAASDYMETDLGREGKIKFAPIPGIDGPAPNFVNNWGMGIPAQCPEETIELAWEAIKYMSRPDIQAEQALIEGGMPMALASYEDPAFLEEPYVSIYANLSYGHTMDPLVHYQEGLTAAIESIHRYFFDPEIDLQQALDDGVDDFNYEFLY